MSKGRNRVHCLILLEVMGGFEKMRRTSQERYETSMACATDPSKRSPHHQTDAMRMATNLRCSPQKEEAQKGLRQRYNTYLKPCKISWC